MSTRLDIENIKKEIIGLTIPKPVSGTLSGHAAGEPFDKLVYSKLKERYPNNTYRQFEYLNKLYLENLDVTSIKGRHNLIKPFALAVMLSRGSQATIDWSPENLFDERQNDTADILVVTESFYQLIDVKTYNVSKKGQPPNIISALKLANMCKNMIDSKVFNSHEIIYISVDWVLESNQLKATGCDLKYLFKSNPEKLYINWAAAMQIQFYVDKLEQTFNGSIEDWCHLYLKAFVKGAQKRASKMLKDFVEPFSEYTQ